MQNVKTQQFLHHITYQRSERKFNKSSVEMSRNQSQLLREKISAARGNVRAFTVTNNNGTSSFCKTNTESDTKE